MQAGWRISDFSPGPSLFRATFKLWSPACHPVPWWAHGALGWLAGFSLCLCCLLSPSCAGSLSMAFLSLSLTAQAGQQVFTHSPHLGVHVPLLAMALLLALSPSDPTWTWPLVSRPRCLCPAAARGPGAAQGPESPQPWLLQPLSGLSNLCALLSTPSCLFPLPCLAR